ncbi:helix-turn-helix domain-containing protein [Amycolatopsis sp. cmx-4-61]|uniref:helix-turn-helix domain-containing protein n=1 Tax=Amycolatopsis sp. cmx-4-61 TaxID=2790937 RepID=UPI003978BFC1
MSESSDSDVAPDQGTTVIDPEQARLGARLRQSREYLGLSQKFVADRTGIPRSAISDVERGVRKVDSLELKKFALVYTRPVGYFLDENDDADPGDHTVQVVARRLGGMSRDDLAKVVDYVEMVEVRARLQNQAKP